MKVKLVTLNLRYDNPGDGPWRWELRRSAVLHWLKETNADLVALQEVLPRQRLDLDRGLPHYRSYGISRDGRGQDEQCVWLVRHPYWIEFADTLWLSPTPRQVSVGWDACLPRVCSVVRVGAPQGRLWAANVHLDHVGVESRRRSLELVAGEWPADLPGLLVGDFNEADLLDRVPLLQSWKDVQRELGQPQWGTFHDFQGGRSDVRLDAILYSPHWQAREFELPENPILSDHYPLVAGLEARLA